MKYILTLVTLLVLTNNSFSNNELHYDGNKNNRNMPKTMPNNDHINYVEKMNRLYREREYRARIDNERRIRNMERQRIFDDLGYKINLINY